MKVLNVYPPNFAQLIATFPIKGKPGILYAYGDTLYNPDRVEISPWILAHEELHGIRQLDVGVKEWWRDYVARERFRYTEELLAHRAEWRSFQALVPSKKKQATYLKLIAQRLSSPLYGSMVTYKAAREAIKQGSL